MSAQGGPALVGSWVDTAGSCGTAWLLGDGQFSGWRSVTWARLAGLGDLGSYLERSMAGGIRAKGLERLGPCGYKPPRNFQAQVALSSGQQDLF